jgi:DNA mismatch endonuclease (patch repair protein)
VDTRSPVQRRRIMQQVRSKNTRPELIVRKLIFSLGYRYRLHDIRLPGSPDIVFRRRKIAIFVHGCFWHLHENCRFGKMPKSKLSFWRPKLLRNRQRDRQNLASLRKMKWRPLVIWQCELKNIDRLQRKILHHLGPKVYK